MNILCNLLFVCLSVYVQFTDNVPLRLMVIQLYAQCVMYVFSSISKSTVHPAGTATDSNTTVIFGALGGLVGLLLLIVVGAVILGLCVKLCICRKKQKYTAAGAYVTFDNFSTVIYYRSLFNSSVIS